MNKALKKAALYFLYFISIIFAIYIGMLTEIKGMFFSDLKKGIIASEDLISLIIFFTILIGYIVGVYKYHTIPKKDLFYYVFCFVVISLFMNPYVAYFLRSIFNYHSG